ncbi:hypothetical protein PTW35_07695 [Photobacterium sp. DA100]|uniref:hypothetical protein n=1 Tax=Photobacterium sp. DA100 TaxID=3027472 RepID=UPI00247A1AB2|nr:hypothetical protein [Photobacterium sp. DA100]WEM43656.1 hypothetical protein PTW35_07695 [Photobacterium sp. DA100]
MKVRHSTLALAIATLLAGCGAEDNKDISGKQDNVYPPTVRGEVTIPALHVGAGVKGIYQYFDPNPAARPEGASQYRWLLADDTEIGIAQELYLVEQHLGEQVRFCVTPVAEGTANTIGAQSCSEPKQVQPPLGTPPQANDVTIGDMAPMVGDVIEGEYQYYHPEGVAEGDSVLSWLADGEAIDGADDSRLTLLAHQTEGKQLAFCVEPKTQQDFPVVGEIVCSELTAPVAVKPGSAPEVEAGSVAVDGQPFVGASLTGKYTYFDADGDLEGTSQYRWLRDNNAIEGATETAYSVANADDGYYLSFCVTPVSETGSPTVGEEVCQQMDEAISVKVETPPQASSVEAVVLSGGLPEVGETLVGQYQYEQAEGAEEGQSTAQWKVDGVVSEVSCDVAQSCQYTLSGDDLGKTIEYCVTPVTYLGTPADQAYCSPAVEPMGITLTGALEYDQKLTAVVYGYDGNANTDGRWLVDTSNQNGPAGDSNPTEQATGNEYIIGVRAQGNDSNGNGVVDDYDWAAQGHTVDARNFIGKGVQYCLNTQSYGTKCVSAADFDSVSGGLLTDASNAALRVIEPIRIVDFNGYKYHRPLTQAETVHKGELGAGLPQASEILAANGIDWALFAQITNGQTPALNSCRNLYQDGGDWHLPISQFTAGKYVPNYYEANGNQPPTSSANSMIKLTKELISNVDLEVELSPVYGWPLGTALKLPYGSASRLAADQATQNYNVVRFYQDGGTANNYTEEQAPLITCVSLTAN